MTKQRHRLSRQSERKDKELFVDDQIKPKKSLGKLRPRQKTHPKSPDATGKFKSRRHELMTFLQTIKRSGW
jgi:hypothetical protein